MFIPQGRDMGAVTGHKVVVRMTDFGGERKNPEGVITEIIGHVNDPGTDIFIHREGLWHSGRVSAGGYEAGEPHPG